MTPESLSDWIEKNSIDDSLIYKTCAQRQFTSIWKIARLTQPSYYINYKQSRIDTIEESRKKSYWDWKNLEESRKKSYWDWKNSSIQVISTHTSKSIKLPVYQLQFKSGPKIIMRDNFYDWKLSVISELPVPYNFHGLFDQHVNEYTSDDIYFEGFPEELVFGSYSQDQRKFSLYLLDDYEVWTFVYLLRAGLNLSLYQKGIYEFG